MTLQKNNYISLGVFFPVKALQAPFCPNFAKRTKLKHDFQKKRLNFDFRCHFCKIIAHTFCEGLHTFCPNFHRICPDFRGICPDFYQIKTFGDALAPPEPPPPTPVILNMWHLCKHKTKMLQNGAQRLLFSIFRNFQIQLY